MLRVPNIENCYNFARALGCSHIYEVPIEPREHDKPFQCHKNCEYSPVLGYYIVADSNGILHAFKHSVLDTGNRLVDVTPTYDSRRFNVFCYGSDKYNHEHLTYMENSVFINKETRETELMYYVYGLIDPRNNKVFYIGKGKDNRALRHFAEHSLRSEGNTKKTAKIKKLNSLGYDPMIEFYAQNIEDEQLAYDIEAALIKKYGRIGIDPGGILTNVCIDNRPPNHAGKSYKQTYGDMAEYQRKKRHDLQIAAGGWFAGRRHSEETKLSHSKRFSGKKNPRYGVKVEGTETAKKIGNANRGKKHYNRKDVRLLYIDGIDTFVYSNDLKNFCNNNNFSYSTFVTQLSKNWPRCRKGMNKGLKIRYASETEITSYVIGGVKKDVNEDTFKGFSL